LTPSRRANSEAPMHPSRQLHARIRPADWVLSTGSGVLLAASHPPWQWNELAWVALVPLLFSLDDKSSLRRLVLGLVCGAVWSWVLVGRWLFGATGAALATGALATAALTVGATQVFGGFYVALFALLHRARGDRAAWFAVLTGAALWVGLELLRSRLLGGLPWCLLGHSQWDEPRLIQVADLGGVYAVSFVLAAANVGLARFLSSLRRRAWRWSEAPALALPAALVTLVLGYGTWRLGEPPAGGEETTLQVVYSAWSRDRGAPQDLFRHLVELTSSIPNRAPLVVWPENSLRFYVQRAPAELAEIGALTRHRGQFLIAGGPRFIRTFAGTNYYNSVLLFGPDGDLRASRDKRLLVPLVETPWAGLPTVERPFRPGRTWKPLDVGETKIGVLICFEAIFPRPSRILVDQGAQLLLNVTNDELVGDGARQQMSMAAFRAVENRVPFVRVANLGPTVAMDSAGRLLAEHRGDGTLVLPLAVEAGAPRTAYMRWGDVFAFCCAGLGLWGAVLPVRGAN
jgi:apolipoprotein N-acyltransferase